MVDKEFYDVFASIFLKKICKIMNNFGLCVNCICTITYFIQEKNRICTITVTHLLLYPDAMNF